MAKPYNGHHCWNCWNVALWLQNDEPLYRTAVEVKRRYGAGVGARVFIRDWGLTRTPDGARYTTKAVRDTLAGLE